MSIIDDARDYLHRRTWAPSELDNPVELIKGLVEEIEILNDRIASLEAASRPKSNHGLRSKKRAG